MSGTDKQESKQAMSEKSALQSEAGKIENYTTPHHKSSDDVSALYKLTIPQICLLAYQQFVQYLSDKCLYPFAAYFAEDYNVSLSEFAYVVAAVNIGGILSIFISPLLIKTKFHFNQCALFLLLAIVCFLFVLWKSLVSLVVLRIVAGIFQTLIWSQITSSMGAFLSEGEDRTCGVMAAEASWTLSTLAYVAEGWILQRSDGINLFWAIMAAASLMAAFVSWWLPHVTIYDASEYLNKIYTERTSDDIIDSSAVAVQTRGKGDRIVPSQSVDTIDIVSPRKQSNAFGGVPISELLSAFSCGNAPKLWVVYVIICALVLLFVVFMIDMGTFMKREYGFSSGSLGIQTLIIAAAECTALSTSALLARYKGGLWVVYMSSIGGVVMSIILYFAVTLLSSQLILILVLMYVWLVFKEYCFLNIIVLTLDYCPKGYEMMGSVLCKIVQCAVQIIAPFIAVSVINWVEFSGVCLLCFVCYLLVLWCVLWVNHLNQPPKNRHFSFVVGSNRHKSSESNVGVSDDIINDEFAVI